MSGVSQTAIAEYFLAACRAELQALKPGNVHVHAAGHGMDVAQFEAAATAAAPWVAASGINVGKRILRGVEASFAAAGCNTNLGILLLCAPLAAAAEMSSEADLRDRLRDVLAALDADDADAVYTAIRHANPGGLGDAAEQDVATPPTIPLIEAMRLAADRDRIACDYTSGFADIFEFGLPIFEEASREGEGDAVTRLHMAYLAQFPDSHIARKYGAGVAGGVRDEARALVAAGKGVGPRHTVRELLIFDADLKRRGINPGTTADLVVATLFAASLCDAMGR
jgi:triphosphoribosyl-dephospho-CoA synthase